MAKPLVVLEDPDFLVVAKPAGMHTAPLRAGEEGTLLGWVLARFPEVAGVPGLKPVEPGLLHRLDGDTSGLVLVARDPEAWQALLAAARAGRFVKRYRAIVCVAASPPEGTRELLMEPARALASAMPLPIESGFRAWGPGRRRVAAVAPSGARDERLYRTLVLAIEQEAGPSAVAAARPSFRVLVELVTGFRHQVRVHLAAIGLPIAGDALYGAADTQPGAERLMLHACRLEFPHPRSSRVVVAEHEAF